MTSHYSVGLPTLADGHVRSLRAYVFVDTLVTKLDDTGQH